MSKTNKDKDIQIDESILDLEPPNINEPQVNDADDPDNVDPNPDEPVKEKKVETQEPVDEPIDDIDDKGDQLSEKEKVIPEKVETQEQKDQRYRAQQTEAQIQAAKNKNLISKVDEASKIPEPTTEELKLFVAEAGVEWDELTVFEQSTAKRTYLAEKRFALINEAVQSTKKIDEWAGKVDTFIDSTDSKPEFAELSGHESDFRRYCMQESHRGTPIDILLGAFLHNLPVVTKKRGELFPTGSGGDKVEKPTSITDADSIATLRTENPREYKRQIKAGTIKPEL